MRELQAVFEAPPRVRSYDTVFYGRSLTIKAGAVRQVARLEE